MHWTADDGIRERQVFCAFADAAHRAMIRWLALPPGASVLDAGCGTGEITALLCDAVGESGSVTGIDICPTSLALARERNSHINFVEHSIEQLDESFGSFDLVWESRALHGGLDAAIAIGRLRRCLKPGGRLVLREGDSPLRFLPFAVPGSPWGLESRLRLYKDTRMHLPGYRENTCRVRSWRGLLADAGAAGIVSKTFFQEYSSPFPPHVESYIRYELDRYVDGLYDATVEEYAAHLVDSLNEDKATLRALLDPQSDSFLFRRTDLHLVHGLTLHVSRWPAHGG